MQLRYHIIENLHKMYSNYKILVHLTYITTTSAEYFA